MSQKFHTKSPFDGLQKLTASQISFRQQPLSLPQDWLKAATPYRLSTMLPCFASPVTTSEIAEKSTENDAKKPQIFRKNKKTTLNVHFYRTDALL